MTKSHIWHITSFYAFFEIEERKLAEWREAIDVFLAEQEMCGLVLVAQEGVNGTVSGTKEAVENFKRWLEIRTPIPMSFKDSESEKPPFRGTRTQIRQEIVGLKRPDLVPLSSENHHLSPKEWHEMMLSESPKVIVDTRNTYETRIGKFQDALDPQLNRFSEWPSVAENLELPKDIPVLIYCTGGIRCEKVMLDLIERGHENVYQLKDGILGYLEQYPDGLYEGECFVFDDRIAVDQHLNPSRRYGICPGCGEPTEHRNDCQWCHGETPFCTECREKTEVFCSRTCDDRIRRHGPR